jgi:hypothetical protein
MNGSPPDGDTKHVRTLTRPDTSAKFPKSMRKPTQAAAFAERVALGMIARHGANAAREATVRLNRMIDRGNLPARDLWACVVHVIHERRA